MAPVSYLVKKMASTLYTITHFLLVSMKHCHLNILMFLLAANLCPFTLAFPQILYSTFQSFLLLQFFLLFLTCLSAFPILLSNTLFLCFVLDFHLSCYSPTPVFPPANFPRSFIPPSALLM